MARQKGILGIRGTIGGMTFAKDGTVRTAREPNKEHFKVSDSMARTRENASEFTTVAAARTLLRLALRRQVNRACDNRLSSRLQGEMAKIIALDSVNVRGQRQILKENLGALTGLDFNLGAPLATVFSGDYAVEVKDALATLTLTGLVPDADTRAPAGATHYALEVGAAVIDFEAGTHRVGLVTGVPAPAALTVATVPTITVTADLITPPTPTEAVIVVLGLSFFQQINGLYYSLQNKANNPLGIVFCGG